MILFLDFDGVLHRVGEARWEQENGYLNVKGERLFERLPLLEDILRENPHVDVVIMSTWRRLYTLEEIRSFFSADVRDRITGMVGLEPYSRHELATNYVLSHDPGREWVALDDELKEFPAGCDQLVLCDGRVGMDTAVIGKLQKKFSPSRR